VAEWILDRPEPPREERRLSRAESTWSADETAAARAALGRALLAAGGGTRGDAFLERTRRVTLARGGREPSPSMLRTAQGAALRTWNGREQRFASADGDVHAALGVCLRQIGGSAQETIEPAGTAVIDPARSFEAERDLLRAIERDLAPRVGGASLGLTLERARRETLVVSEQGAAHPAAWGWSGLHVTACRDGGPSVAWTGGAATSAHLRQPRFLDEVGATLRRRLEALETRGAALPRPHFEAGVVFGPGRGALLLHELTHGLEADAFEAGWSLWNRGKGSEPAPELSPLLNVWDDPLRPGLRGSFDRDDEGSPADRCHLIRRGRVIGRLGDRPAAEKDPSVRPGHARRSSRHEWPLPRAANLHLSAGPHDARAVREEKGLHLVIHDLEGGGIDPLSGALLLTVSDAEWWDSGRRLGAVSGMVLEGDLVEVLSRVDRVCADRAADAGSSTCAREGSGVPIGFLSPSFRTRGLTEVAPEPA
jgi:predicted Zn-dependent protease